MEIRDITTFIECTQNVQTNSYAPGWKSNPRPSLLAKVPKATSFVIGNALACVGYNYLLRGH